MVLPGTILHPLFSAGEGDASSSSLSLSLCAHQEILLLNSFELMQARDIFEEGMASVLTIRDFGLIFDARTKFEDAIIAEKMELLDMAENVCCSPAFSLSFCDGVCVIFLVFTG